MVLQEKTVDNLPMANRLKALRERHGLTQERLAERAKCHPVTVAKMEARDDLPVKWARRFGEVLGESVQAFYAEAAAIASPTQPDLPVYGVAAGSTTGAFTMTNEVVDWVRRPPGLAGARDAYALFVRGASMEPRFFAGDVIYVAPHRPVRHGDVVVIQQHDGESGGMQVWLKVFDRADDKAIHTFQYNPAASVRFTHATVKAMHRVLTTNELLGF